MQWGGEWARLWIVLFGEQYCKASEIQTSSYIWKFISLSRAPWKDWALKQSNTLCTECFGTAAQHLTVVVEAVRDLVPDDHSYAAVVQGFGLGGTEERGLQNARREDWKRSHSTVKALPHYPAGTVRPDHFYGFNQNQPVPSNLPAATSSWHVGMLWDRSNRAAGPLPSSDTSKIITSFCLLLFCSAGKSSLFQFTSLSIHRLQSHHWANLTTLWEVGGCPPRRIDYLIIPSQITLRDRNLFFPWKYK